MPRRKGITAKVANNLETQATKVTEINQFVNKVYKKRQPFVGLYVEPGFAGPAELRAAYVDHLLRRVAARGAWQP